MAEPQFSTSRAVERAAVAEALRAAEPGETISYATLDAAAECSVKENRHIVASARVELRDEDGIVFEAIPNVGYRRLTDSERATVAPDRRRRRAYRQASNGLKEMRGLLESPSLTAGERQQALGRFALLGAVAAVATHKALQRVLAVPIPDTQILPLDKTLSVLSDIK